MGKHYAKELKEEVVKKYFNGEGTLNSLQKEYNISLKTIYHWLEKERLYHTQENDIKHKRGRTKEENEYFFPMDDSKTVLLIDKWKNEEALDIHHKSPMMKEIQKLREKYHLKMRVEKYKEWES